MTGYEIAAFRIRALYAIFLGATLSASAAAQSKIYWTDISDDRVYRANLDGTGVQILFQAAANHNADLYDLEIDPAGTLYWAGDNDGLLDNKRGIRRANLDGTNPSVIQTAPEASPNFTQDVELDPTSGFLYVATQGGVIRVKRDGSSLQGPFSNRGSEGLALDTAAGKVYWTEYGLKRIMRSNLDGTNIESLYSYPQSTENSVVDIEVDHAHGWLFWINALAHQIVRSDLNGGNVTVLRTVDGFPEYLDIDRSTGLIYYTINTGHRIERMDLNGQNVTVVLSGLTNPIGVKIGPAFAVPEPSTISLAIAMLLLSWNRRSRASR
jgi:sugar lactone lactonase YvrE